MKVYVIRHGESETNYEKKWTGWLDVNLTEKGMNDAKKAGEFLASVSLIKYIQVIFCGQDKLQRMQLSVVGMKQQSFCGKLMWVRWQENRFLS